MNKLNTMVKQFSAQRCVNNLQDEHGGNAPPNCTRYLASGPTQGLAGSVWIAVTSTAPLKSCGHCGDAPRFVVHGVVIGYAVTVANDSC